MQYLQVLTNFIDRFVEAWQIIRIPLLRHHPHDVIATECPLTSVPNRSLPWSGRTLLCRLRTDTASVAR